MCGRSLDGPSCHRLLSMFFGVRSSAARATARWSDDVGVVLARLLPINTIACTARDAAMRTPPVVVDVRDAQHDARELAERTGPLVRQPSPAEDDDGLRALPVEKRTKEPRGVQLTAGPAHQRHGEPGSSDRWGPSGARARSCQPLPGRARGVSASRSANNRIISSVTDGRCTGRERSTPCCWPRRRVHRATRRFPRATHHRAGEPAGRAAAFRSPGQPDQRARPARPRPCSPRWSPAPRG